jgi:hypothetical protein
MSAALGAEAVTAGVEGRLEDRPQDLEHRLLNHSIQDVRNAEPPFVRPLALLAIRGGHRRTGSIPSGAGQEMGAQAHEGAAAII